GEFPELVEAAKKLPDDVVLDGEIIAYAEGKKLTFFDLQKRLGRKRVESDLFLGEAVPVSFIAFDLLWKNGTPYIDQPLHIRRDALETVDFTNTPIKVADVIRAETSREIEAAFIAARQRQNEGLIAKLPDSTYSPGRRGKAWLKLKKASATLDVVVIKAQQGHGKRSHVLSDYTFAIRDPELPDQLFTIGKAYSGLTDAEIEELTEHFMEYTLSKRGRVHTVEPNIVLEIAFDSIQPSQRHNSGLSLRFPRIKAIRKDKTPAEIDTLQYARQLAGLD
ncbi:MAG: DNA ligase, partial [Verrucomicrobiota bacterium]